MRTYDNLYRSNLHTLIRLTDLLLAALEIVDLVAVDLTAPREYTVEKADNDKFVHKMCKNVSIVLYHSYHVHVKFQ